MSKRKGIQSTEDLREELECPVCLVIPKKGPIYQCEFGHTHCRTCHPALRACPVCRGPIGNTRALKLEKVLAMLPTKCAFTEFGCLSKEQIPEEMILHEKECQFRLVKCFYKKCKEKVPLADYVDHCLLKHPQHRSLMDYPDPDSKATAYAFWRLKTAGGVWKRQRNQKFIKGEIRNSG